jgi:SAM-dependent methyltransferase
MEWYENDDLWTQFAGVMFPERRKVEAAERAATSPLLQVPPGAQVLDQACGPGIQLVPLAQRGAKVTGLDISDVMLGQAQQACDGAGVSARFVKADMREHVEHDTYDLIVNVYTAFGYFEDHDDNLQVLRNAHASLVPGGSMVVDLLGKEIFAGWVGRPKSTEVDGGVVFTRDTILDSWTRRRTDWTIVRGDTARTISVYCWVYSGAELKAMFEAAGFGDVECFGDFDCSPYDNHAKRLVVRGTRLD